MSQVKRKLEKITEEYGGEFHPAPFGVPLSKEKHCIFKSLAMFQQECPNIHKTTQGYGYKFADLPTILGIINPLLKKYNLALTQPLGGKSVRTILFHTITGETIESEIDIPQGIQLKGQNDFQVLGSAITYLRRYSISSLLNIVVDNDTDIAGEQVTKLPTIKDADFVRLVGAINSQKTDKEGVLIDLAWAKAKYTLTPEQINTIEML
jgi:hypothetical protein